MGGRGKGYLIRMNDKTLGEPTQAQVQSGTMARGGCSMGFQVSTEGDKHVQCCRVYHPASM